jgi:hypothetical protein
LQQDAPAAQHPLPALQQSFADWALTEDRVFAANPIAVIARRRTPARRDSFFILRDDD